MYRLTLASAGFNVHEADDGESALGMLDGDGPLPDVVVLDLWMPTLDGLSLLAEWAANSHTRNIPVVVVTGTDIDAMRIRAAHVLRKPVDPDDLVAAVRRCLQDRIDDSAE
jgi:DNA-binding NtrC family response regulator